MKLPYQLSITEMPLSLRNIDTGNLTAKELLDLTYALSDQESDRLLVAMTKDVASISNCVGACLIQTSAHGYKFQDLAIQNYDGNFTIKRWNELDRNEEILSRALDLDLRVELQHLRQEGLILKTHGANRNIDRKSQMEGRFARIYIVAGADAEWLDYPNLLRGGVYENSVTNRILCAIYGLEKDITFI